jgi:hypothetical protein
MTQPRVAGREWKSRLDAHHHYSGASHPRYLGLFAIVQMSISGEAADRSIGRLVLSGQSVGRGQSPDAAMMHGKSD